MWPAQLDFFRPPFDFSTTGPPQFFSLTRHASFFKNWHQCFSASHQRWFFRPLQNQVLHTPYNDRNKQNVSVLQQINNGRFTYGTSLRKSYCHQLHFLKTYYMSTRAYRETDIATAFFNSVLTPPYKSTRKLLSSILFCIQPRNYTRNETTKIHFFLKLTIRIYNHFLQ